MEDCGLRQKRREEDSIAGSPVYLLLGLRKVAGGGSKKDLRDRETDLVAVCGEAILMLKEITEGELRFPARAKATTDSPSDLFLTAT